MPKLKYNDGTGFEQIVPSMEEFNAEKTKVAEHLAEKASDDVHGLGYSGAFITTNAPQTIPDSEFTKVVWNQITRQNKGKITWDSGNPTRIVIGEGVSKIRLFAQLGWGNSEVGKRAMRLLKNNATLSEPGNRISRQASDNPLGIFSSPLSIHILEIPVVQGDYFELGCFQTSGSALNTSVLDRGTYIAIEVIE